MKIALLFPPSHDFSMPYLAPPYLKGFLNYHVDIECKVFDINQQFYLSNIGKNDFIIRKELIINALVNNDLLNSVNHCLSLDDYCQSQLDKVSNSNYHLSLKKITPNFNPYFSENIIHELHNCSDLEKKLERTVSDSCIYKFDIIGITISVEDQILPSFLIAKIIKKNNRNVKIIFGGSIPTRLCNSISKSLLSNYLDFIVLHEGEYSLLNLIYTIKTNNYSNILNDNKIVVLNNQSILVSKIPNKTSKSEIVNFNHNDYYSNFDDLELNNYLSPYPILPINITRRCYWAKCDFCSIYYTWDNKHRRKKINYIIDEIKYYIKKYNVTYFRIVDEDLPPLVLDELCSYLIKNNLNIFYELYSRFENKFLSIKFCRKLFQSGCRQIFFGLENIGKTTLKLVNKGNFINKNNVSKILKNCHESGISNYLFLLFGIPNSPIEDEYMTIEYLTRNMHVDTVAIGTFLVDLYSPIHSNSTIRNKYKITLFSKGDLTTEIGYKYNNNIIFNDNKQRTKIHLNSLFSRRHDLAISSLLSEETRFILTSKFGNSFMKEYITLLDESNLQSLIAKAIKKTTEERIERKLS